jgi:hypothetical protein
MEQTACWRLRSLGLALFGVAVEDHFTTIPRLERDYEEQERDAMNSGAPKTDAADEDEFGISHSAVFRSTM